MENVWTTQSIARDVGVWNARTPFEARAKLKHSHLMHAAFLEPLSQQKSPQESRFFRRGPLPSLLISYRLTFWWNRVPRNPPWTLPSQPRLIDKKTLRPSPWLHCFLIVVTWLCYSIATRDPLVSLLAVMSYIGPELITKGYNEGPARAYYKGF